MNSSFNADAWAQADVNAPLDSNDPPSPGTYEVVVSDAKAFTSKKGDDYLLIEWRVTAGPQTGYAWPDIHGFKNEGAVGAAKGKCASVGVDIDQIGALEDLDGAIRQVIGEFFVVEVAQNGSYLNTFVKGRQSGEQAPLSDIPDDGSFAPVGAAKPDDDDPCPF